MVLDMSNNHPSSRTKDFFASPALSLTLAGVFRDAGTPAATRSPEVEEGDEESIGGGVRDEMLEISSENTGPGRSDEDGDADAVQDDDDADDDDKHKKKKRKKYHRHTAEQIREMEALFKESPHPDEKQRQQLSKQLGLAPRQVKFWFQNRRTQIKAIQERHENSLLKSEIDKLREENRAMRDTIKKASCPNCGFATSSRDTTITTTEEQQLRIENAKLKAEVEKLRSTIGKCPPGTVSPSSSCSAGNDQENRNSSDYYTGIFGLEKTRILEIVNQAMEEVTKMAIAGEPLWIRSVETGREILNYDEYVRVFAIDNPSNGRVRRSIEASRETGVVFVELPRLVQAFMDVNQWKEMFPGMISKGTTVDVICSGEGVNRNGAVQLMFVELQMLTPMVPTREVYFIRYCKQLSAERWAIVDVSIDKVEQNTDAPKCKKRPSGCIIEDKTNGHCKVIWVEHLECQKSTVHTLFRSIVNSGLAFGAKHWMATLQLQCERLVFFMATNVPTKDSLGVATLAGRKSILKLAQRMTWSFCRSLGASSFHTWTKISTKGGDDIRVASRKNLNDPAEPQGVILCAVSSVSLSVSPHILFDFLRDETRRNEWDIMSTGGPAQSIANLAKGQDRGNAVTLQATKSKENSMWILQDSCINAFESMVVFAPVDITGMQSVMTGCDSSNIAILPSGFSILPDGLETRPLVFTSKPEEKTMEGGSLLTIALQILAKSSPTAKLTMESVETVTTLISCTLQNIKTSLQCEEC
ncbi:homeobox-leucine zipper protein GLABRA 2-like [Telopea speciosissima]|uniref:homeobox-leucine zipper protein GLABRA 2-like n=1 Tax=Telopea speciosissima TaxID=54955 RepID=UPI001CC6ADE7|nr:homeobox-leucine zipper protein GLABRA 2-like [Telopea speciosissima]